MKTNFIKTIDTAHDLYGVSLIAENLKEKQLIKKMVNANYVFKTVERQVPNLTRRQVLITLQIENAV